MRNTSRRYMIDLTAADRVRLAHVRNGAAETDDGYLLLSLVRNFFARSGVNNLGGKALRVGVRSSARGV